MKTTNRVLVLMMAQLLVTHSYAGILELNDVRAKGTTGQRSVQQGTPRNPAETRDTQPSLDLEVVTLAEGDISQVMEIIDQDLGPIMTSMFDDMSTSELADLAQAVENMESLEDNQQSGPEVLKEFLNGLSLGNVHKGQGKKRPKRAFFSLPGLAWLVKTAFLKYYGAYVTTKHAYDQVNSYVDSNRDRY